MENYASSSEIFTERQVEYGTFMQRFGAALIDGIVLSIANGIINYAFGHTVTYSSYTGGSGAYFVHYYSSPGGILNLVINWLYFALQESGPAQATLGKRALGLRVTTTDHRRISFATATGRYFGKFVSMIILLIGYLMVLWDDKRQALHDKMAGTLVVKQ